MNELKGKKVAVAGLTYESNSFAPGLTEIDQFERYLMVEGPGVLTSGLGKDEIAGATKVAHEAGIELVPTFSADGGCGATVSDKAYAILKARLLESLSKVVGKVDGVYLRLHGAMTTQSCEDVESDVIESVRGLFGKDFPIAVSTDFHAHFTEKMAKSTSLLAGYQTCPHIDMYETGARAMKLMVAALGAGAKPVLSYRKLKLLASSEGHDTSDGPMREVLDRLHEMEKMPGVLDATVFCTQPWLEVEELGWSAVVVTENNLELGQKLADELTAMMWERRERVMYSKRDITEVLQEIQKTPGSQRPYVLADGSDSPSAGSSGDSSYLLTNLLKTPINDEVYMTMTDAPAVKAMVAAGVGAEVTLSLGGTIAPNFFTPVAVTGKVITLCDGVYQSKYPSKMMNSGMIGVLRVGTINIVITSKPAFMLDYQLYLRVGLDVITAKVVQVKSAGAYRAYYAPLAYACIDFASPGASDSRLPKLPFTKPRRPLWPFDRDITEGWY